MEQLFKEEEEDEKEVEEKYEENLIEGEDKLPPYTPNK
jgi:hypothetical protein